MLLNLYIPFNYLIDNQRINVTFTIQKKVRFCIIIICLLLSFDISYKVNVTKYMYTFTTYNR